MGSCTSKTTTAVNTPTAAIDTSKNEYIVRALDDVIKNMNEIRESSITMLASDVINGETKQNLGKVISNASHVITTTKHMQQDFAQGT